eukprot:5363-Eustigmatos_ZCMA.PRE.1
MGSSGGGVDAVTRRFSPASGRHLSPLICTTTWLRRIGMLGFMVTQEVTHIRRTVPYSGSKTAVQKGPLSATRRTC